MREMIQEGWNNFREGGGLRTVGRRFAQTAPFWILIPGGVGFAAGEILPGMPDLVNRTNATTTLYANEYGSQWGLTGVELGAAAALIDAVSQPFRIGAAIRCGEIYDVPEMPNIVEHALRQTRKIVDHVRGRRQEDAQDALSSFYTTLPPTHEE